MCVWDRERERERERYTICVRRYTLCLNIVLYLLFAIIKIVFNLIMREEWEKIGDLSKQHLIEGEKYLTKISKDFCVFGNYVLEKFFVNNEGKQWVMYFFIKICIESFPWNDDV